jgi:hypothetical protein
MEKLFTFVAMLPTASKCVRCVYNKKLGFAVSSTLCEKWLLMWKTPANSKAQGVFINTLGFSVFSAQFKNVC